MYILLTIFQLRDISLELDRASGDVMRWQYGAAVALNYVCILHEGDESVARVVVAARYVLYYHKLVISNIWGAHGAHLVVGAR